MKMILLKDVKNYGKAGDIVNVSDGYGKNYLLPQKLAVIATNDSLKINTREKLNQQAQRAQLLVDLAKIKTQLATMTLVFKLKSNKGKVSGAISAKQVCEHLAQQYSIIIDKHKFVKFSPINNLGVTTINIKLDPEINAQLKIEVIAE